jgi:hypothetical protein
LLASEAWFSGYFDKNRKMSIMDKVFHLTSISIETYDVRSVFFWRREASESVPRGAARV